MSHNVEMTRLHAAVARADTAAVAQYLLKGKKRRLQQQHKASMTKIGNLTKHTEITEHWNFAGSDAFDGVLLSRKSRYCGCIDCSWIFSYSSEICTLAALG